MKAEKEILKGGAENAKEWNDWRWQLRHAVRGGDEEVCAFGVEASVAERVQRRYPVLLTPYALAQLSRDTPADPLNRQALPSAEELDKHAKRALAQSMARELGPQGIHVAHVVIDGAIDTDFIRQNRPDIYEQRKGADGLLAPDAIAETFWQIHCQPRVAWTFETDLRPWAETW